MTSEISSGFCQLSVLSCSILSYDPCGIDKVRCVWSQEAKLLASDKRTNALFGSVVAINDNSGVIAVGAPNSKLTGVI